MEKSLEAVLQDGRAEVHIQAAQDKAAVWFHRFPDLQAVSIDIGFALALQFSLTATFERPQK